MGDDPGRGIVAGTLFEDRYELLEELGSGSFGRVIKARQINTGQLVALKLLRPARPSRGADTSNRAERFRRELRLCAELSHPNIVRLLDSGETSAGTLYAVFEFVPGMTLRDLLAAEEKLGVAEALHLMTQVLDALSCAHAHGVVHRDLKPENIMVSKTGFRRNAMVLDFGLGGFVQDLETVERTRLTATNEMLGTPIYAAPEQLRGEAPTPRADLYSWGLILLECVNGTIPMRAASVHQAILEQMDSQPILMPEWLRGHPLEHVLTAATEKVVERRSPDADTLLQLLCAPALHNLQMAPREPPAGVQAARERRQVTIVCCRVTLSPSNGAPLDIEEVDQALQRERTRLSEMASRNGGTVINVFADRMRVVFGYPQAREDDTRRAARLAFDIVSDIGHPPDTRVRLEVRVGIHTGMIIVREANYRGPTLHDLTGTTPQIASELVDMAAAGEVMVSRDTYNLLRHNFGAVPAGECVIPELSEALPVFRLLPAAAEVTSSPAPDWSTETPLTGRRPQMQQLEDACNDSAARQGRIVLVLGEAGIGKSRLLRELRRRRSGNAWIECRCAPEDQSTALRPVIETLLAAQEPIEDVLTRHDIDLADDVPILRALLSESGDKRYPLRPMSPERQKELTLQALVRLLFGLARDRPTVFAVENLHWADPTTVEFLTLLIQEVCAARYVQSEPGPRLCVLLSSRPDFSVPWSSDDVTILPLPRLSTAEVNEMIGACLVEGQSLDPSLVEQVAQRAEGVPLFVEEIARLVLDSSRRSSGAGHSPSLPVTIPSSLRDLLTARLDRVSTAARETAQWAAVVGRGLSYDLLRMAAQKEDAALRRDLLELGRAGLIYESRGVRGDTYIFRHALIRDAAYEAIPRTARQTLHRRVADVLHEHFPETEQRHPAVIAQHFELAGDIEKAVGYWSRAGSRSYGRAAYAEANAQLEHALNLVRDAEPTPALQRREVDLLVTHGTLQIAMHGWAAKQVEETFARAIALCEQRSGTIPPMVLYGWWSVQITRSNAEGVGALLPHMETLSQSKEPILAHMGHACVAAAAFWRGDFAAAHPRFEEARRLADSAQKFAYDGRLYSYTWDYIILWGLGFADQAEALCNQAFEIARGNGDPYSLAIALAMAGHLGHDRGETERVQAWAQELIKLADEQHLAHWSALGQCALGLAAARQQQADEGVQLVRTGLQRLKQVGVLASYGYYLTYLAETYLLAGRIEAGLDVIAEGLDLCGSLLCRFHEPELLRLRGELLLRQGHRDAARDSFRKAKAIAAQRGIKGYELRAAMALLQVEPRDQAIAQLRQTYGQFSEGFTTADLRAARELLDSR